MNEVQRIRVFNALQDLISQNAIVDFTKDNITISSINLTDANQPPFKGKPDSVNINRSENVFFKDPVTTNLICRISEIAWEKYAPGFIDGNAFYLLSEKLSGRVIYSSSPMDAIREFRISIKIKDIRNSPCVLGIWIQPVNLWYETFELNPSGMNTKAAR